MNLTNKTNGRFFWREGGNKFFVEIDGKPAELKFTLAQSEAYQALIFDEKAEAQEEAANRPAEMEIPELLKLRISKSINHACRVAEIALNPKSEKQYTREQVMDLFSEQLDLLQIVSRTWVDKKVFNPILDSVLDPHLAP